MVHRLIFACCGIFFATVCFASEKSPRTPEEYRVYFARLRRHVSFLNLLMKRLDPGQAIEKYCVSCDEQCLAPQHPLVNWSFSLVTPRRDAQSILEAINLAQKYVGIDAASDKLFIRECGCLIFGIYHSVLKSIMIHAVPYDSKTRVTVFDLVVLYAEVISLDLDRLFTLLDITMDELAHIVGGYHVDSDDQSAKAWLKQFWWVPTVIAGGVAYKFLVWLGHQAILRPHP